MRNKLLILFIIIITSATLCLTAQELNLSFETGLGTYKMSDLKEINNFSLESLPFKAEITNNFPPYFFYKSSLLYSFRKVVTAGVTCSFNSTGSRISYSDYSGEYYFDSKIRAWSPGIIVEFYYPAGNFRISFCNEAGMEFSRLELTEYLRVNTSTHEDSYHFEAKNYYYEPALKVSYPFSYFRVGFSAGYLFDINRGILFDEDTQTYLSLPDGGKARPDWSGLRLAVSLSINLFQSFKTPKFR